MTGPSLVMGMWAETFPDHKPEHFVFPTEKCGADFGGVVHQNGNQISVQEKGFTLAQ